MNRHPTWFYVVIAAAAAIFAGGSALHNISANERYTYHPATESHSAIVFDGRAGTACQWIARNPKPNLFVCLDYRRMQTELWHARVVRHFPMEQPDTGIVMDTGMKMMDSTAMMDSLRRALRRE